MAEETAMPEYGKNTFTPSRQFFVENKKIHFVRQNLINIAEINPRPIE